MAVHHTRTGRVCKQLRPLRDESLRASMEEIDGCSENMTSFMTSLGHWYAALGAKHCYLGLDPVVSNVTANSGYPSMRRPRRV
ncbi:THO complex component [Aspergillus luchuensis]|uniref:THO complex component n=1 Tax=Aspergillus kawachii TaxID=1069201 RepID=A0A146FNV6_ASPKA|nr:THO complex component [Aspergillus luchuensis]